MDMFVVEGGKPLQGTVAVSGAKNAALPIMAAALLADEPLRLRNVPRLVDVATMTGVLRDLGVSVERGFEDCLTLDVESHQPVLAEYDLVRRMRAGVSVLGPLLAKRGRAVVSLPGGCNIGTRPIDLHLKGLRALGADIRIERGYVVAEAGRLRGATIDLAGPHGSTVTGTCNVMSAATLAKGTTVIKSAAREPEVVDLGECLNKMGAQISGLGSDTITIDGVDSLGGTDHCIIPDRIEAATLMIATAITRGEVTIEKLRLDHLTSIIAALRSVGIEIGQSANDQTSREIRFAPSPPQPASPRHSANIGGEGRGEGESATVTARTPLQGTHLTAAPHPRLPTDVQAQFTALLTTAAGMSTVRDTVFPDRFMHAAELNRMGANIRRDRNAVVINGVERLSGANVMASDLRASAALVLAAIAAEGATVIRRIYHLDRGYESLETKLNSLGANIRRVTDVPENVPAEYAAPRAA